MHLEVPAWGCRWEGAVKIKGCREEKQEEMEGKERTR